MKVSLNWIKKYVDIPAEISDKQIAYDLTVRTVEVEKVVNTGEKYHDIIVGEIKSVDAHPNADRLRVCMVDVGEHEHRQIVCGGSNLYEGEKVVVSRPGAEVYWHGEDELIKIKETKMRGVPSWGMICGASEVYLDDFFPADDEKKIVDLSECVEISDADMIPGRNIAELIGMKDTVLEIDNKSLTNRPDLWGHYGIAREIAAIYELSLKPIDAENISSELPEYEIEIEDPARCNRYKAIEIENVTPTESPIWMKAALINGGMRPVNAIVDITNYVMLAVGQPIHGFDRTHVEGEKIIVRNAKEGEQLKLLDGVELELTDEDLVICDISEPMALAGIRGGIKDSILPDTTGVLLEIASFTAEGLRRTGRRFDEKTDASIRYDKGIDTERVDMGAALALKLFREIFSNSKIVAHGDVYPVKTKNKQVNITQDFLDIRLGRELKEKTVVSILEKLGYDVCVDKVSVSSDEQQGIAENVSRSAANVKGIIYRVSVPSWRSTGDVSIKDDVLGDLARMLSYETFEPSPLPVKFEHAVHQPTVQMERRIREYLAYRCGYYEVFTYPWIDEKYIKAARISNDAAVMLATPPSPEQSMLRRSLVPGMIESASKNLRYFEDFKIFEMGQVFEKRGKDSAENRENNLDNEKLPVQTLKLSGAVVGNDARSIFFDVKGMLEEICDYCHIEKFSFTHKEKPSWSDDKVYLNLVSENKIIGDIGLLSFAAKTEADIKRSNVAIFEIDVSMLTPLSSRSNKFVHLPQFPLVEEDLSIVVDESVSWEDISGTIKFMVREIEFIEEYRGKQIPAGKKSVMLRFKMGNDDSTMTSKQIDKKLNGIIRALQKKCGAELRKE